MAKYQELVTRRYIALLNFKLQSPQHFRAPSSFGNSILLNWLKSSLVPSYSVMKTCRRIQQRNMRKLKRVKKIQAVQNSTDLMRTNWFEYVNNDDYRLAIPVGPRFQAVLPDWTSPPQMKYELESSMWLGTKVWPLENRNPETEGNVIKKRRLKFCSCLNPGSVECVKRHVIAKRIQLQTELGPAFWKWKFDEMGEEVSKSWNQEDRKRYEDLVRKNPISQGKSFMKPALKSFPSQCRKTIVSYYFNVYLPRRMGCKTRSGCTIDTDDEEGEPSNLKGSRKRYRADVVALYRVKPAKARYLTGRR